MSFLGKTLHELKVLELKNELEKRGLDKTGVKATLMERLEEAVRNEGHDICTYQFDVDEKANSAIKSDVSTAKSREKSVDEQSHQEIHQAVAVKENEPPSEVGKHEEEEDDVIIEEVVVSSSKTVASKVVEEKETDKKDKPDQVVDQKTENVGTQPQEEEKEDESASLWVSNIPNTTKASDLKLLFMGYGKVSTAKIFTTRSQTAPACYGLVTMCDPHSATEARTSLHRTNWKGRIISVEVVGDGAFFNPPFKNSQAARTSATTATRKPIEPPAKSPTVEVDVEEEEKSRRSTSKTAQRAEIKAPERTPPKSTAPSRTIRSENLKPKSTKYEKSSGSSGTRRGGASTRGGASSRRGRSDDHSSHYRQSDHSRTVRTDRIVKPARPPIQSYSRGATTYDERRYHQAAESRYPVPAPESRFFNQRPSGNRYFDEAEVRRLMLAKEDAHRRREETLEREKERAKLLLEKEKLEREKLEVQRMKLQLQIEAQQQAQAHAVVHSLNQQSQHGVGGGYPSSLQPLSSSNHKGVKKPVSRISDHRNDERLTRRPRSRSPPPSSSRRTATSGRRSRSPPPTRRHDSSTNRTDRNRTGGSSSGYQAPPTERRPRSPVHYPETAYGTNSKRTDSASSFNEKLAVISGLYGAGNNGSANSHNYSFSGRSSQPTASASYNRLDNFTRYGAAAQSGASSYSTVTPSGQWPTSGATETKYETNPLPGSWSRPQGGGEWFSGADDTYNKSYGSRRY